MKIFTESVHGKTYKRLKTGTNIYNRYIDLFQDLLRPQLTSLVAMIFTTMSFAYMLFVVYVTPVGVTIGKLVL